MVVIFSRKLLNFVLVLSACLICSSISEARDGDYLPGPYVADVLRVLDGDTVEVRIQVWLNQSLDIRIRLRGIDAPEVNGKCRRERIMARQARRALADLIEGGSVIVTDISGGKYYGRVLATIRTEDGRSPSAYLLAHDLARPYLSSRKGFCVAS